MSKFRNIVLPATTPPPSPKDGQIYHDSTLNQIRVFIDGSWISLGAGTPGQNGVNGKEIELQKTVTHIQWRYVGDSSWINLISLSELTPNSINAINVITDSNNRFVSDVEKETWNNKQDAKFIPDISQNEIFRGYTYQQNSTSITSSNITASSAQGTISARSVSTTNLLTKQIRCAYTVSTPAMNQKCGVRVPQALWSVGSGFRFVITFAHTDSQYNSGARQFYGMTATTTVLGVDSTVTVDSLLNMIGIGSDTGDAGLSIYHNDGSGVANKIQLSSTDFPANRTLGAASSEIFSFELYNNVGENTVKYKITNLNTKVEATGILNSDLPANTTLLSFQGIRTSGSSSNACSFELTKIGCYNLY